MRKRWLVYSPRVAPYIRFVYFDSRSGSVYDFSGIGAQRYSISRDKAEDLLREAKRDGFALPAPTVPVKNLAFWHRLVALCTTRIIAVGLEGDDAATELIAILRLLDTGDESFGRYPMLDEDAFAALPKVRKRGDVRRMRFSPDSEDWVTWNGLRLLQREKPQGWWQHLVEVASRDEKRILEVPGIVIKPKVRFWESVPAPSEYLDGDPRFGRRAEGESEIEVQFRTDMYLLFAEAKLGHDISPATSHDAGRDQIARNIDCLLSVSAQRWPMFWMLVRDLDSEREYLQLMRRYRNPDLLAKALPHRPQAALKQVSSTLAVLSWASILEPILGGHSKDEVVEAIRRELQRRIGVKRVD